MVSSMFQATTSATGLLLLRFSISGLMLTHAWQEWTMFNGTGDFPDPIGLGSQLTLIVTIISEVILSLLLVVGLATRFAAFGLANMMAVALIVVYADDPWQKKELVVAYLSVYITLLVAGGGPLSIQRFVFNQLFKRKSRP